MNQEIKFWRFSHHIICSIVITAICIFSDVLSELGTNMQVLYDFSLRSEVKDVGRIGGADGPTVLYLEGTSYHPLVYSKIILFLLLIVLYVPVKELLHKVLNKTLSKPF